MHSTIQDKDEKPSQESQHHDDIESHYNSPQTPLVEQHESYHS